ncbi:unnamed protein product [Microthlaspi erraticum]|uniref:Uncharacterized protein n=1 Tax=Microthlaspi erraticum TaxID=1685480 RepID=A0A6D2JX89_9BRAS|nr:unnamed protein product [Microthlaspi erraticum]
MKKGKLVGKRRRRGKGTGFRPASAATRRNSGFGGARRTNGRRVNFVGAAANFGLKSSVKIDFRTNTRKMIEKTLNKQQKVCAIRDFPYGCGTQCTKKEVIEMQHSCVGVTDDQDYYHRCEEVDGIMKKAGFSLAANGSNVGKGRLVWAKRKLPPSCGSKVKPLGSNEVGSRQSSPVWRSKN